MSLRVRLPTCLLACLLALPVAGVRADTADAADERERIETERRLIEAAFADEESACLRRFIVTPCVEAVQARRREALAPLRHQELLLDEAERRARAAARLQAIDARRAAAAQRPPEAPAVTPTPMPGDPQAGPPAVAASAPGVPLPPRATPSIDRNAAAQAAARRAAAAQRRREEAAADRARIAERRAQQQGQRSAPLPVPRAPAAASTASAASAAR
ncbi:hypothetical protein ACPOLB_02550 [Rubrivivax sp. RP6-9]|uniref:hypothetical protein n=1 Tax=Rubrivivax sp. RP6-9 TaxID=3415750 RepID=UPI003CC5FF05